jgi:hypothetical protein
MRISPSFAVVYRSRLSSIGPSMRLLLMRPQITLCYAPVVAGNTIALYSAPTVVIMTLAVDFM